MMCAAMKPHLALLIALLLTSPTFARKGDIVPVAGKGIDVVDVSGKKAAEATIHGIKIRMHVSTGEGFFALHVEAKNTSDADVKLAPLPFSLVSEGDPVDSLEAEAYMELKYPHIQLLPVDKKGNIKDEGRKKEPLKVFTPGSNTGVPGQTGSSLAEQMTSDTFNEASYQQRVEVTKEAYALKANMLRNGGTLEPGKSASTTLHYQRNSVQLPCVARFEHAGVRANVKFIRSPK
jgi:hypothetical protein